MASDRHSYVRFFPSDWIGGTARLPRMHRSVYFDLCCYIWDIGKPVPPMEARLMLSDVPEADQIISDLIEMGKVERTADGCLSVARALEEANRAFDQWQKRSFGGKGGRARSQDSSNTAGTELEDSSKSVPAQLPRYNQNQNQNHITGQGASGDALTPEEVVEEWNDLARDLGLATVRKLTAARKRKVQVRLNEYPDLEDWQRAFNHIRNTPFLRGDGRNGWRADFDFLIQAASFTKLTEEAYGKD